MVNYMMARTPSMDDAKRTLVVALKSMGWSDQQFQPLAELLDDANELDKSVADAELPDDADDADRLCPALSGLPKPILRAFFSGYARVGECAERAPVPAPLPKLRNFKDYLAAFKQDVDSHLEAKRDEYGGPLLCDNLLDKKMYQFKGIWGGGNAGVGGSASGADVASIDQYCKLASSKLGEIRGKNTMLSLTPKSVHRALRETSTTCQISPDGQRVVIDRIPDDDVSSSARALSGAPASRSARASSGAPASSSAGSAPLSTTAMRGLRHISLNGELGVARHSLHKL